MAYTTARGALLNMTMIESWEVERHEAAVERRRRSSAGSGDGSGSGKRQQLVGRR